MLALIGMIADIIANTMFTIKHGIAVIISTMAVAKVEIRVGILLEKGLPVTRADIKSLAMMATNKMIIIFRIIDIISFFYKLV